MMSCSIPAAAAEEREAKLDSGLVKGHAYGITDVKLVRCVLIFSVRYLATSQLKF